jgi:hypothetical protein
MKYVKQDFSDLIPGTICLFDGCVVIVVAITEVSIGLKWGIPVYKHIFRYRILNSPYYNTPFDPKDSDSHNSTFEKTYNKNYSKFHYIIILEDHEILDIYKEYRDKYMSNPKVQKKILKYLKDA